MLDKLFAKTDIIATAMTGRTMRNNVISNNIANADTPGYKKKVVEFENMLQDAVGKYKKTGELDLEKVKPSIQEEDSNYSYRLDGNNVDIDTEMAELTENQIAYYTLASCISFEGIKLVLGVTG